MKGNKVIVAVLILLFVYGTVCAQTNTQPVLSKRSNRTSSSIEFVEIPASLEKDAPKMLCPLPVYNMLDVMWGEIEGYVYEWCYFTDDEYFEWCDFSSNIYSENFALMADLMEISDEEAEEIENWFWDELNGDDWDNLDTFFCTASDLYDFFIFFLWELEDCDTPDDIYEAFRDWYDYDVTVMEAQNFLKVYFPNRSVPLCFAETL